MSTYWVRTYANFIVNVLNSNPTAAPPTTKFDCSNKADGNYKDPTTCTHYWTCANRGSFLMVFSPIHFSVIKSIWMYNLLIIQCRAVRRICNTMQKWTIVIDHQFPASNPVFKKNCIFLIPNYSFGYVIHQRFTTSKDTPHCLDI